MVFARFTTLVQTQWVALCGHLRVPSEAERQQRRQDRRARRQLRKQARAARKAARRSRRKGSAVVDVAALNAAVLDVAVPPPVVSAGCGYRVPSADNSNSNSDNNYNSDSSNRSTDIPDGQAWAATAAAMAQATSESRSEAEAEVSAKTARADGALVSQRRSPECVLPPAAAKKVAPTSVSCAFSASLEASVETSAKAAVRMGSGPETLALSLMLPLPRDLALELEAQLEQKQRQFYDSLGGYSTVDEEDDELHELLAAKNPAVAGATTVVASVQEEQSVSPLDALVNVQTTTKKAPESLEELPDTEPEDDDVDLRDGYSSFGEDEDECGRGREESVVQKAALLEAKPEPESELETGAADKEEAAVNKLLEVDVDAEELPWGGQQSDEMDQDDKMGDASPVQVDEELEVVEEEVMEVVEEVMEYDEVVDLGLESQVLLEEVVEIIEEYEEDVAFSPADQDMFGQTTPLATSDSLAPMPTAGVYNPGIVDEYASSILANLRAHEAQYQVTEDVFTKQPSVRPKMRAVLVDWLVEVHQRFELETQTLYLTINYIDRYLAQIVVNPQRLQLVGITALLVASKFEEIYPCDMEDLLYICERTYTKTDLVDCEREMLNCFHFNLAAPTVSSFLNFFLTTIQDDELVGQLANYFSERALVDFSFGAMHKPSVVAASCLLLAICYVENQSPALVWSSRLVELTGLSMDELGACPQDLWETLNIRSELTMVITKYSAEELGEVATLPLDDLQALLF